MEYNNIFAEIIKAIEKSFSEEAYIETFACIRCLRYLVLMQLEINTEDEKLNFLMEELEEMANFNDHLGNRDDLAKTNVILISKQIKLISLIIQKW